ncbi:MAG: hypothetical protein H6Q67_449 [Firmicutes bacterium]|nr:hypothetical protein [Bacillota bacterium]
MNVLSKKTVIGMVAGALIMASAVTPFVAQAMESGDTNQLAYGVHQRHFNSEKMAQNLTDTFGVNKEEVLIYQQQGIKMKDLFRASFLAKASGRNLKEVMAAKTYDNSWKDVATSLGISRETMKAVRSDIASAHLEKKLGIPKQTSLDLMEQGYHAKDIAVANELAKNTGRTIVDILSMRSIKNTWFDVAQNLGVNEGTFKQDMKSIRTAFGHHGFHQQMGN